VTDRIRGHPKEGSRIVNVSGHLASSWMKAREHAAIALSVLTFVSMFSLTFIVPSIKEFIIDRFEATATEASLFITVEMIAYVVFAPLWGALSDKIGERRILIFVGFLGSSMLYAAMALSPNLPALLVLRFAQGTFTVMAWSLIMTMALDIASKSDYGRTMGIIGTGLALGLGIGAPAGGVAGDIDPLLPLYIASAMFLAAAAITALTVRDVSISHRPTSIAKAMSILTRDRRVIGPYLLGLLERFSAGFIVLLLPLMLADDFGMTPSARGFYLAAFLLPFALLQYPFGMISDRRGRATMLIVGGFAYGLVFAAIGFLDETLIFVCMIVGGALAAILLPTSLALIGDLAPKGERATLMGGFNSMGSVGFAVAPPLAALLSDAFDYSVSFLLGGVAIILMVGLSAPFVRSIRPSHE